jgi:hypothetical protein
MAAEDEANYKLSRDRKLGVTIFTVVQLEVYESRGGGLIPSF